MLLFSVFLLILTSTDAFIFPKACLKGAKLRTRCCPLFSNTECGSGLRRGSCVALDGSWVGSTSKVNIDMRYIFPSFLFTHKCVCTGNFAGPDCGRCKPKYTGSNCDNLLPCVRPEVRQMSVTDRIDFFVILNFCKDYIDPDYYMMTAGNIYNSSTYKFSEVSYYNLWCYQRILANYPFINNSRESTNPSFLYGSTGSLTGNRMSLLFLEDQLGRCMQNYSICVPYYDWRDDPDCAVCNDDYFGATGPDGFLTSATVFSNWRTICTDSNALDTYCVMPECICEHSKIIRRPGLTPVRVKPTRDDVEICLNMPYLDTSPYNKFSNNSFRTCIEGWRDSNGNEGQFLHRGWLSYCGGTMASIPTSCNDPLYILELALLDKFFDIYLKRWKSSYPPNPYYGHRGSDCIIPLHDCYNNQGLAVTSDKLGYIYTFYNDD